MIAFRRTEFKAVMVLELAVTIGLLSLLIILTANTIHQYNKASESYYWRQAALLAAEAQLTRYQLGVPLDSLPPKGAIAPEIKLSTSRHPGSDLWEGFDLITVTATANMKRGKPVSEKTSCYILREER